ncbi:hypothetical protein [Variovorax sp. IB41]|uniref:hypothetical protein n=1 Tax=Variovorax sp. IB41 TaxID=2779370 RepID=UPI001A2DA80E|nr:hypothetical protein [Variovorax sp. IB41]MBJ2154201.1 hypothetical protein [Variovorax sp. IB41]
MNSTPRLSGLPKLLAVLTVAYFLTSLGHFTHNAEFICEYPNLPASLTSAKVYAAWVGITSVGVLGFLLIRKRFVMTGLLLVAAYALLGFDGLGHYALAPMAWHTRTANLTILSEVVAAALLLAATVCLLALRLRERRRAALR